MSVRPSICQHRTTLFPLDGFLWNFKFENLSKNCPENSSLIKIGQEYMVFYVNNTHLYLAQILEWEMFQTKVVEKIKTHILCSVTFFLKSCRLWDNVAKYCWAGQVTDDNMAHAHCMLHTRVYKYTRSGCVKLTTFPLKRWLHEHTSMLRHTYTACQHSISFMQVTRPQYWHYWWQVIIINET